MDIRQHLWGYSATRTTEYIMSQLSWNVIKWTCLAYILDEWRLMTYFKKV